MGLAGRTQPFKQQLNRDVNVFFGPNGSGKTSLLRILHSALQNDASLLRRTPFRHAEVRIQSIQAATVLTRTYARKSAQGQDAERTSDELPDILQSSYAVYGSVFRTSIEPTPWHTAYAKKPKRTLKTLAHVYLPTSRLYAGAPSRPGGWRPGTHSVTPEPLEEDLLDEMFAGLLEQRWRDYTASILRQVQSAQAQGLARILKAFLAAAPQAPSHTSPHLDLQSAYERVNAFLNRRGYREPLGSLAEFTARYESDPRLQQVAGDIDEVEVRIGEAMAPRTRLQELVTRLFAGPKEVSFTDAGITVSAPSGVRIPLGNLSSGEKHLLRILVEVMLAGGETVLIDEPEISMHVDWQAHFVELVRSVNPRCQLILATHSPEVASLLPDSNLFRL